MGDGEMALVPGVQYGLSSHDNFDEHKSLIFAKLTDSSYRAIQEYLKNRHKIIEKPKIQFLQNEGKLSIPSIHGIIGFTFSLSSNQDIEGPQGGFECVRQTGPKSLESLGAIPYKMRIQANDDVYETTRHRMAVAEENNKNKCTRVIKANGPDIGRKVKVQVPGRTIPLPSSHAKHWESTTSIPTSGSNQHRTSTNKPTASNSSNSNHVAATRSPEKKVSDIMRRPLKERLIHVLALRPYKKPELYDRINKEGLRERERPIMTTILKQVAYMRDNTYHLQRHIWNDVQEDWPFYTEQERTMLRRRKPQNLTPPGSSDGSSGSGQSPNSIHAGSPPAITAPPPSLLNNKRPGYYQGSDGLPTKKPRISHYKKPEPISFIPAGEKASGSSYSNNNSGISATAGGERAAGGNSGCGSSNSASGGGSGGSTSSNSNGNGGGGLDGWESKQQRERSSRADYRVERTANSDVLRGAGNGYGATAIPSGSSRSSYLTSSPSDSERNSHHQSGGHGRNGNIATVANGNAGSNTNDISADRKDRSDRSDRNDRSREAREERNRERECRNRNSVVNDASDAISLARSETSSCNVHVYNDNASSTAMTISPLTDELERPGSPGEYPDYLTYYTTISNAKQKRRYKEEFYANYDEYCRLHSEVVVIANRFRHLYKQFLEHKQSGNLTECEATTEQIQREYKEIKQNRVYQQMKTRFHYLHDKLSHIKRLILEYETENTIDTVSIATNIDSGIVSTTTASTNVNLDLDSRHY
ncbi:RNA polymerase II elongation factor Ell [Cataglyphis hispanica]|uniref:RNA polymerase II elongation factor Ell n=1 Tax=Cataglyphis hispanica TaxID=1086592 RepID=UPI0021802564|nr:RNA polymerase II elongation factor Ell [Cataglyphis hispanica]